MAREVSGDAVWLASGMLFFAGVLVGLIVAGWSP